MDRRPRVLVVGGTGGFVGRAVRAELAADHALVSLHRHEVPDEAAAGVQWLAGDLRSLPDPGRALDGVQAVVTLAWFRSGPPTLFRDLASGLSRLLAAAREAGVGRFVHLSVPPAPAHLEAGFPYLTYKRQFDRELAASGLSYRILRPTLLYGPGDVLLGVMMRTMRRYRLFPMFGDGEFHVSPLAVTDLARAIRLELASKSVGTVELGGPVRYRYRELTDRLFAALGQRPRYWRLSPRGAVRLARLLESLGSSLLYAYEVQWLQADLLGLPPYAGLDRPLMRLEEYLEAEAARRRGTARG